MKKQQHHQRQSPPTQMTAINGDIKALHRNHALFEIVFCNCFQNVCRCKPLKILLPKAHCQIKNDLWEIGSRTVKLPLWLLNREINKQG